MIRVRFAPSPTGFLHIGGLRTYLYNWLLAKKSKGKIILRIEDTDRRRFVQGATENLIKTLKSIGLPWDEGPKENGEVAQKGKYGPYLQSQRRGIYQKWAWELVNQGKAYCCFCSPEELGKIKREQIKMKKPPCYNRTCRNLNAKESTARIKSGQSYVIRLKVPEQGKIEFKDLIRGKIEFDLKNIDDQVLLKSDNWPTYHLANVVDDHLMKITHVIRGEEWLPSTPKHILIYQAFGWSPPQFAHLPLLLNPDHSKLSKRQGDVSVEEYLRKGYLSQSLLNYLALLGWNPGDDREIFSLKQLIKDFSLEKIQKGGAVFNKEKLDWLNGYYLRRLSVTDLTKKCLPYLAQKGLIKPLVSTKNSKNTFKIRATKEIVDFTLIKKIVILEQERLKRLDEIGELAEFFFIDQPDYDPSILLWKKTTKEQTKNSLKEIKKFLDKIKKSNFKNKEITKNLAYLSEKRGTGEIFWPLRVALSGRQFSPPPAEIAEILGKEKTLFRIDQAIEKIKN